jgi:hypothetical protein
MNDGSQPKFRDNLSVVKKPKKKIRKKKILFLNFLTLEEGTDRLSRNVGTGLPLNAA